MNQDTETQPRHAVIDQRGSWNRGSRYVGVHTATMLAALEKLGWAPSGAAEVTRSRLAARRPFARHMLLLDHPELSDIAGLRGAQKTRMQLLLQNSHDASCAFSLRWGVYRFACANGLVVGHDACHVRLPHRGQAETQAHEVIEKLVAELPRLRDRVGQLASVDVDEEKAAAFVRRAYDMRLAVGHRPKLHDVTVDYRLPLLRRADAGQSAWLLLNRVQERVVGGGIAYAGDGNTRGPDGKPRRCQRTTRPVREVRMLVDVNARLWRMAEEMVAA